MKRFIPVILLTLTLFSCKVIYLNSWDNSNIACDIYEIYSVEGRNDVYPAISKDSVGVFFVTIIQRTKKYDVSGPDYCLLSLMNEKGDTLARSAINGMPEYGRPRTYTCYGKKIKSPSIELKSLHVSLPPYCENIRFKIK